MRDTQRAARGREVIPNVNVRSGEAFTVTRTIHATQSQGGEWKKLNGRNLHKDKHTRLDVFSGMASTSVIFNLIESTKKAQCLGHP